jgi:Domain of Unknown Function with PDB structure (DUF3857)
MGAMKRCISSVILWAAVAVLIPVAKATGTVGWLPVPPEDLALKDNPKQPGADAMILYREDVVNAAHVTVGGDTVEEYLRIKIFTQEGTKEGHVEIPFVKDSETVSYVAGRTIEPDGTVVNFDGQVLETTGIKMTGLKVLVKAFTLPDVKPGCIVEYRYQLQGKPDWVHDRSWEVTQPIYTREAHFTYVPFGGYGAGLVPMHRAHMLPADAVLAAQVDGSYTMTLHDIPGIVQEPLMPPQNPVAERVEFYYQDPDAPMASDPTDKYWGHYAKKWDGELEHFVDKKNALSQELAKIVGPNDSPEVKLRKIYARVLQIRNLNFEDSKTQKEAKNENLKPNSNVEDVLNRGYGTEHDINELFIGLARSAGFDATEVYVASRSTDLFIAKSNDVRELQEDVVWVSAGGKEYYLDPGAHYYPFGLLPWFETETGGIKVDKRGATEISTPNPVASDSTIVRRADLSIAGDGSIAGTLQIDFGGQDAAQMRDEKRKEDETGRTKELEEQIKNWLPVGATFEITKIADWDDVERPVHVEGTVKMPSFGSGAVRHFLMPLEIFQATQGSSFATAKRVNPIYFHYPYQETDDLTFHCSAGYTAESVPTAQKMNLGAVSYQISATQQGDGIEVKRQLVVNGVLFGKEAYPTLRAFFGAVRTDDNAQMVLQSSTSAKNN